MNQIIFIATLLIMGYLISQRFGKIAKTIHLAKPIVVTHSNERWKRVILLALGQKKFPLKFG
jgi:hypothetical protein